VNRHLALVLVYPPSPSPPPPARSGRRHHRRGNHRIPLPAYGGNNEAEHKLEVSHLDTRPGGEVGYKSEVVGKVGVPPLLLPPLLSFPGFRYRIRSEDEDDDDDDGQEVGEDNNVEEHIWVVMNHKEVEARSEDNNVMEYKSVVK
jgi:hypothetical protein